MGSKMTSLKKQSPSKREANDVSSLGGDGGGNDKKGFGYQKERASVSSFWKGERVGGIVLAT